METMENFLVTHSLVPDLDNEGVKILVTHFDDVPYEKYTSIVKSLRDAGLTASLYLGQKKFGKQIDYAVRDHYSHVVIMGGDELASGTVKVKNLATREENSVELDKLSAFFA